MKERYSYYVAFEVRCSHGEKVTRWIGIYDCDKYDLYEEMTYLPNYSSICGKVCKVLYVKPYRRCQ